jgi:hypothetical protein
MMRREIALVKRTERAERAERAEGAERTEWKRTEGL